MEIEKFQYDNKIVKNFAYATMLWGVVGMLAGLVAALQLVWLGFLSDQAHVCFCRAISLWSRNNSWHGESELAWGLGTIPWRHTEKNKSIILLPNS